MVVTHPTLPIVVPDPEPTPEPTPDPAPAEESGNMVKATFIAIAAIVGNSL